MTQTERLINVQGLDSGKKPLAATLSDLVRPGRSTSRPQLRAKSNLIPGKSLFLTHCSSGMATQYPGAVLFLFQFYPPIPAAADTKKKKTENLHIFVKALPFSPFTVSIGLRSESS